MEFELFDSDTEDNHTSYFNKNPSNITEDHPQGDIEAEENILRRGTRERKTPPRYEDFELYSMSNQPWVYPEGHDKTCRNTCTK